MDACYVVTEPLGVHSDIKMSPMELVETSPPARFFASAHGRQRMAALREPPDQRTHQPQQEGGGGIALDAPFEMDPSQLDEEEGTGTCMPDNCSYFYQEQPSEWDEVYHPQWADRYSEELNSAVEQPL